PWYSLGSGSLLEVASMIIHACQMTGRDELAACYDMITDFGAKTFNIADAYGLAVGKPANLITLDADNAIAALRDRATIRHVISRGSLLVSTSKPEVSWQRQV
ncbi:MAG: cytosine deaminase, partial [Cyanobacteria bacterium P01_D01_bin.6]